MEDQSTIERTGSVLPSVFVTATIFWTSYLKSFNSDKDTFTVFYSSPHSRENTASVTGHQATEIVLSVATLDWTSYSKVWFHFSKVDADIAHLGKCNKFFFACKGYNTYDWSNVHHTQKEEKFYSLVCSSTVITQGILALSWSCQKLANDWLINAFVLNETTLRNYVYYVNVTITWRWNTGWISQKIKDIWIE